MNTLQTQTMLPSKSTGNISDTAAAEERKLPVEAQQVVNKSDRYIASAANDAVVAKVLSFSINKSVEDSMASEKNTQSNSLSEKFKLAQQNAAPTFDIESVTKNIVDFVSKALSTLAVQGHDTQKLEYFKNQAISGVEVGIDQAKIELIGLVDDKVFNIIDDTRDLIIDGIKSLPNNRKDYLFNVQNANTVNKGTDNTFSRVNIIGKSQESVNIDFETNVFKESQEAAQDKKMFTTSASNITFSIEGQKAGSNIRLIANLVNKIDGLANSFYRGDVESSHSKSMDLGYTNSELISLSAVLRKPDNGSNTQKYGEIQRMTRIDDFRELTAPKAVAEYLNRYLDVLDSSKSTLNDEQDFKQILSGLVNQMKDVQVPDLLQAINRFHSFNAKFG